MPMDAVKDELVENVWKFDSHLYLVYILIRYGLVVGMGDSARLLGKIIVKRQFSPESINLTLLAAITLSS